MKSKILILSMAVIALFSCKKDKNDDKKTETPVTHSGFTCKVNGADWSADKNKLYIVDGDSTKGVDVELDYDDSSIYISAVNIVGTDTTMFFGSVAMKQSGILGNYTLSIPEENVLMYIKKVVPNTPFNLNFLATVLAYFDETNPGTITGNLNITKYDAANKLVSAEFNFTQTPHSTQASTFPTITVTNGSIVDVKYTEIR